MQLELQVQTTQGAVQFQSWQERTGCQRAPDKVWLQPHLIQLAPCYLRQPTRISRQNHTTSLIRQPRPCTTHCSTACIALATISILQMQILHLQLRLFCECNRGCSCTAAPITAVVTTMQSLRLQAPSQLKCISNNMMANANAIQYTGMIYGLCSQ